MAVLRLCNPFSGFLCLTAYNEPVAAFLPVVAGTAGLEWRDEGMKAKQIGRDKTMSSAKLKEA